jgi:hypothetical protein
MTEDELFVADVAVVFTGVGASSAFGSGRLIAPGLVLTAGHVVDYPTRKSAVRTGWKVRLIREQTKNGTWENPAHKAKLLWRGSDNVDMALVRLIDEPNLGPTLKPVFSSYNSIIPIGEEACLAAGFPNAWFSPVEGLQEYIVHGTLRIATRHGPYTWSVRIDDMPNKTQGWKGMSGAAVCYAGADEKLYLFGAVATVPANFSRLLQVSRVSAAFEDVCFCSHLRTALGSVPSTAVWSRNARYAKVVEAIPTLVSTPHEEPDAVRNRTRLFSYKNTFRVEVWATDHHRLISGITANLHVLVRSLRRYPTPGSINLNMKGAGIRFGPTPNFEFYDSSENSFNGLSPYQVSVPVMVSHGYSGPKTQIELQVRVQSPWVGWENPISMSFDPVDVGL